MRSESGPQTTRTTLTRAPLLLVLPAGLALLAGAAGCRVERPERSGGAVQRYSIEEFLGTTSLLPDFSFSPDGGKVLVSSDRTGVYNAFALPVAGGEGIQLTRSGDDTIQVRSYFPRDERFLYLSDRGGNELSHLYVREIDGSVRDLTPGDNLKADFKGWAADDRSFFITTNERDARYFDLYEVAVDGYARRLLYKDTQGYEVASVSPDKKRLALRRVRTTTDTDTYLVNLGSGGQTLLTRHLGEAVNEPGDFSPDGNQLYVITDQGNEFRYLVRHDLGTGKSVLIARPEWDIEFARLSKRGRYLVVGINEDARTQVRVYETATMTRVALPRLPDAEITSVAISADETKMAFFVNGSRSPNDLFVHDFSSSEARQLTHNLNPRIDPARLAEARVVRFRSYDSVEIPGILYVPQPVGRGARAPAIVSVHGGPGGQSRVGYSALTQYLVNHGYVVYAINNRGSSGYGKTFFKMDDRKHGKDDLGDCVASKEMLVATGRVDPARIAIMGGSYGGYMVLAALAFRPGEFAAGVDIFGVANWVRTLKSIPPYWESFRLALYKEIGDPVSDEAYLKEISPLFHADRIKQPLLVLQGANDPRVLKVESDEIVDAARKNGAPVEYVVFDDEGHGFKKKENQQRGYKAILDFLDTHLKQPPR